MLALIDLCVDRVLFLVTEPENGPRLQTIPMSIFNRMSIINKYIDILDSEGEGTVALVPNMKFREKEARLYVCIYKNSKSGQS